jgi:hypothetical protein
MKRFLILVSVLVILSLALSACAGAFSGGVSLPGESAAIDNTLVFMLTSAIVLIMVMALFAG